MEKVVKKSLFDYLETFTVVPRSDEEEARLRHLRRGRDPLLVGVRPAVAVTTYSHREASYKGTNNDDICYIRRIQGGCKYAAAAPETEAKFVPFS